MRPDQLGEQLREQLRYGPDGDRRRLAQQQQRLIDEVAARRTATMRRPAFAVVAAAALLIISAGILLWISAEPSIECHTDSGRALAEGDWVEAPAGQVKLMFTEGSVTQLEQRSRVRLSRNNASETRLTLEAGKLRAHITRTGRAWSFQAGPYRVRVTGTRLAISWDSQRQQFEVSVSDGEVHVFGDGIARAGLAVRRGERLKADRRRGEIRHLRRVKPAAALDAGEQEGAPATPRPDAAALDLPTGTDLAEHRPVTRKRRPRRLHGADGEQWQRLAKKGDFHGALRVAQEIGLSRVINSASAWDLLLLADAARLGGKPGLARRVLVSLRKRSRGTEQARLAAFRLGRLAFDTRRDYKEAVRWLRRFIAEAPAHSLAGHARGRLMLALKRCGEAEAAAKNAAIYLREHPGGSYAAAARGILQLPKKSPETR